MKLLFGIPTAGAPTQPFLNSLKNLQLPDEITSIENKTVSGNFVPAQRELLVASALEQAADYLLMADDDMVIPPDAVGKLLNCFSNPAVGLAGALYYSRDGLRPMTVDDWDPGDTTSASIPAFDDATPVAVAGIGFGLVLIRTSVFAKLDAPYFPVQIYIEQSASRVRLCNEDYLFCKRLRDVGYKVLLHPAVRCGHYDRTSGQTFPIVWEDSSQTMMRRMMVRKPDGSVGMVPFTPGVPQAIERHQRADVEYVTVR